MIEFQTIEAAQTLAQAILNTIPEPFVVLDDKFLVLSASASFYRTFKVKAEETQGRPLYSLGDGQWDIPALRMLLETIIPERAAMDDFEVEHDFPRVGHRTMLLNARQVVYESSAKATILLAFSDITARRMIEREKEQLLQKLEQLLRDKDVLLKEMQHRVANSLQIIASILLIKARAVSSAETRQHLEDAHQRVMSVAEVQRHLYTSDGINEINVSSYLTQLCASLASSMVSEAQPISVKVIAVKGWIGSDKAVSLGLIVTELLINAIKYAFPAHRSDAQILIQHEIDGDDWKLTISDNGTGKNPNKATGRTGLGTVIVQSLVKQLDAKMQMVSNDDGLKILISRSASTSLAIGPSA